MRSVAFHRYSWAQYLELEAPSDIKHEYLDGEVYAMAGGTIEHALITARVIAEITARRRRARCRLFTSGLRIRVAATGLATYPDASVVCGKIQRDPEGSTTTALNPTVLVEVLSPSTEDFDRGAKFDHYKQIATLKEYVLVSQSKHQVEVFRRRGSKWLRSVVTKGGELALTSIDCALGVEALYEGLEDI